MLSSSNSTNNPNHHHHTTTTDKSWRVAMSALDSTLQSYEAKDAAAAAYLNGDEDPGA